MVLGDAQEPSGASSSTDPKPQPIPPNTPKEPKPKPKPTPKNNKGDTGGTQGVQTKFTTNKGKEINASNMGFQNLREFLELAKVRGVLRVADKSEYMKAMDGFKAAAGKPEENKKHLNTMREIYKRNRTE